MNTEQTAFIREHAAKLVYAYSEFAKDNFASDCAELLALIAQKCEHAYTYKSQTSYRFEIARCVRDCDIACLDFILRSVHMRKIGAIKTPKKSKSSAENGKKGGRPKKLLK